MKIKKRILSLALAGTMALGLMPGMTITALADGDASTYTLTIPSTLTVADKGWNATDGISATGTLADGKKLTVTAASANNWALKSGENSVGYNLATATGTYSSSATPASWEYTELSSTATTKPMGIIVDDYSTKPAGTYQDTVTFTAKVVSASTPLDTTTTAWASGTYAVPAGGLTYSNAVTVSGDVTLVLTDGETLTLNKGISLAEGATLTVEGEGTMTVNGTNGSTDSTVAGTGTLILTSGTLNATGGNGADAVGTGSNITAKAGGVAINGAVTVSGGTLTATGGNGGSITGQFRMNCKGGAGGAAISGALTINGGTVTTTNGTNGSVGSGCFDCTAGAGGAAAAGGVTDNR